MPEMFLLRVLLLLIWMFLRLLAGRLLVGLLLLIVCGSYLSWVCCCCPRCGVASLAISCGFIWGVCTDSGRLHAGAGGKPRLRRWNWGLMLLLL